MNYYEQHLGTTFGNLHSFRDFGLYPAEKPIITAPTIQTASYEVPGRDGIVDLTEALDGMVHYNNREGTFRFVCVNRQKWSSTHHKLMRLLHGQKKQIVVDEEKDGYYMGRLSVEEPEYDSEKGAAFFTVHGDLEPFKYDFWDTTEDWLWDPFSFTNGIIRNYFYFRLDGSNIYRKRKTTDVDEYLASSNGKVVIYGSSIPTVPNIILQSGSVSVTYSTYQTTKTVDLQLGDNVQNTPDLVLKDSTGTLLSFSGNGIFKIKYKTGVL